MAPRPSLHRGPALSARLAVAAVAAVITASIAAPASAQPRAKRTQAPQRTGLGVVTGFGAGGCLGGPSDEPCADNFTPGAGGFLGLIARPWWFFGVEAGWQGNLQRPGDAIPDAAELSLTFAHAYIAPRLYALNSSALDPYVTFGVGAFTVDGSIKGDVLVIDGIEATEDLAGQRLRLNLSGVAAFAGLGMDVAVTPNIAVGAQGRWVFHTDYSEGCLISDCQSLDDVNQDDNPTYWTLYLTVQYLVAWDEGFGVD